MVTLTSGSVSDLNRMMGQRSLVGTALLFVCFAVMLPSVAGYWLWSNMDGDMQQLLGELFSRTA